MNANQNFSKLTLTTAKATVHETGPPVIHLTEEEFNLCDNLFDFGTRYIKPQDFANELAKIIWQANGEHPVIEGHDYTEEALEFFVSSITNAKNKNEACYVLAILAEKGLLWAKLRL